MLNGVELLITPTYALVTNNRMLFADYKVVNSTFALVIGPLPREVQCAVRIPRVPRYLGDSDKAKRWADEKMREPTPSI